MAKQRFEAEVPEGMRLGFSQDSSGGMRGLLFDSTTNKLVGHAEFFEPDDEDDWSSGDDDDHYSPQERDEFMEAVSAAVVILAYHGVRAAAPHVSRWWRDSAVPGIRSTQTKVTSKVRRPRWRKTRDEIPSADMAANGTDLPLLSKREGAGYGTRSTMSSAEARQRFGDAVVAMAFAWEQMTRLQDAVISDDDDPLNLESTLSELSPESVGNAIHLMLEANPSMLESENLDAFRTRLLKVQLGDGDRVPLVREIPEPTGSCVPDEDIALPWREAFPPEPGDDDWED